MYSTCTFCHAPLGANDVLEAFPVGRRLAFDAAKGRLWVVCGACRQWNLSPLDERWEAIEAAERLYRDTKLRVATGQMGLARLRDGSELIRIGAPLRPEFAAWRYGDRFALRFRRYVVESTIVTAGSLAGAAAGLLTGAGFIGLGFSLITNLQMRRHMRRVVARIDEDRGPITFTASAARGARVIDAPDDPFGFHLHLPGLREDVPIGKNGSKVTIDTPLLTLKGTQAVEAARRLLPHVNQGGGRRSSVARAVALLEETGDLKSAFHRATLVRVDPQLGALPIELRLALEMATHEDIERRALEGELAALEASWRDAEEVAAIADSLTLPEWAAEKLARLRGG